MGDPHDPPDWALPAWDAVDATSSGAARPEVPVDALPRGEERPAGGVPGTYGLRILGVGEVTRAVRDALRAEEGLRDVWVEGEVGRVTVSSAGHAYFTLKDERAQLPCVMFRAEREASPFEIRTGHHVVAHGRIDVFESSGVYQLYVAAVQPAGFGELTLRFEALKATLAAEGLFDVARKRPLPVRPRTIAVVTSASGAVWHDIRTVVERRWPLTGVLLVPCQVQGDAAAGSIVAALVRLAGWIEARRADRRTDEVPEVTILARGGGSLEDLWPFNDERVVRAIAAHPVPVVSGVGHEVDVTLVDFVADVRAPTPSAAAELVVPDGRTLAAEVTRVRRGLDGELDRVLRSRARELEGEHRALETLRPAARLAAARERAGLLLDRATRTVRERIEAGRRDGAWSAGRLRPLGPASLERRRVRLAISSARLPAPASARLSLAAGTLGAAEASLAALAPAATLRRGYAIARTAEGAILRSPGGAPSGTALTIELAEGRLAARSEGPAQDDVGGPPPVGHGRRRKGAPR